MYDLVPTRVLEVDDLHTHFSVRRASGFRRDTLRAVNGVSFAIDEGRTLGLVGESGCGKSTLSRTLLGLETPTAGTVKLHGRTIAGLGKGLTKSDRRNMQVVFQDPYASLDPRMSVHDVIAEPLKIHGLYRPERVDALVEAVGLSPEAARRLPKAFSGGQRQRIAIARALALDPALMILDEAVSALDVSIQAQILNLLKALQRRLKLAFLFISHDLSVVRHISDDVAVMYLGRIVEIAPRKALFDAPRHPYTRALLSAAPVPRPRANRTQRIILKGDLPNPTNPPSGCVFRTRCYKATPDCAREVPALDLKAPDHFAACLFPEPAPIPVNRAAAPA
ncbi:peptide ABC transporter substrate-binding protein [Acuticoccus sediminis]|uniref:Peptide ABC transporter substrate-binding protein n=1 Tax=Acuticoccus sediminis TaxID=2184697 RepID=A0A8B2NHA4_9HYPH|nr:oligopeptide/dipeptide ABC transporter ATP-binding protein [Acuticoccus sediminis]RAH98861.1 peptide ABC transporter substrate-binding protein [Acuticoccus sediminis]